jgi:FAD/FMN-containing dehydrogenase
VRSGGHGISGRSTNDGGIVIDLARLDRVEVTGTRARVGPGASWGHVAESLAPSGLAMSSGDYGDVGVGGLATAGGIGFLARKFGLTIDHVAAAELVLADGRIVRADASQNPTCSGRCAAPAGTSASSPRSSSTLTRSATWSSLRCSTTPPTRPGCWSAGASWSRTRHGS